MKFFTIGVYNTNEQEFFDKLIFNKIDTFCDIRQRRGVRGAKYAFVNSTRLQTKLKDLEIKYGHIFQLAPSQEVRTIQKEADVRSGELKRDRQQLGQEFIQEYKRSILDSFDFASFLEQLDQSGAGNVVLFCVEEHPEACHRSIVAKALTEKFSYDILNL
jgi:uncharacterized protein (DUF488 family)